MEKFFKCFPFKFWLILKFLFDSCRKTEPKRMTIAGFLKQYNRQEWYVVSMLPNVMKKDVKVGQLL